MDLYMTSGLPNIKPYKVTFGLRIYVHFYVTSGLPNIKCTIYGDLRSLCLYSSLQDLWFPSCFTIYGELWSSYLPNVTPGLPTVTDFWYISIL